MFLFYFSFFYLPIVLLAATSATTVCVRKRSNHEGVSGDQMEFDVHGTQSCNGRHLDSICKQAKKQLEYQQKVQSRLTKKNEEKASKKKSDKEGKNMAQKKAQRRKYRESVQKKKRLGSCPSFAILCICTCVGLAFSLCCRSILDACHL